MINRIPPRSRICWWRPIILAAFVSIQFLSSILTIVVIDRNGGLRLAAIVGSSSLWQRFQEFFLRYDKLGFSIDISRMRFPDDFFEKMQPKIDKAFVAKRELEAGAIANPDEHRMVGHYWLRNSAHLHGFLRGTRSALYENGRDSITIGIPQMNAFNAGALIALYERAVGFYGSLVNINAYHQPGVEAGKKAATRLLQLQKQVRAKLTGTGQTADEIARGIDSDPEDAFHVLHHLASNDPHITVSTGDQLSDDKFSLTS